MSVRIALCVVAVTLSFNVSAGFLDGVKSLGGAVADTGKNVFNKTKEVVGANDVVDNLESPYIETLQSEQDVKQAEPEQLVSFEEALAADILLSRRAGAAMEPVDAINTYLNTIVEKLLIGWKGPEVNAAVFVVADDGYNAVARTNGGIFIPIDTLMNIESEDELAALLAHEVSHIILQHHAVDDVDQVTDKALQYAQLGVALKSGMGNGGSSKDLINLQVANYLITDAFFPKWNRGQENEADLLGTDLLLAAGYSFNGMLTVLKKLSDYEAEQEELLFEDFAAKEGNGLSTAMSFDVGGFIGQSATVIKDKLASRHQQTEKRMARLNSYAKKFYRDRARPDLIVDQYQAMLEHDPKFAGQASAFASSKAATVNLVSDQVDFEQAEQSALKGISGENASDSYARLVMYELRKMQGHNDAALENLDIAIKSNTASYTVYHQQYVAYWQMNDYQQASHKLDQIEKVFGEEDIHLPYRIDLKRRSGESVDLMLAQCMTKGDIDLINMCQQASGGNFSPLGS